jgi:acyl phosphate:glycerol-3-phosphate acyltransferase
MWWLLVPAAYLVGSLSFAYWAGRIKGIDLRQHGSGNLGATNAGRVLGWHWFAVVFTLDLCKGLAPTWVAVWALSSAMQHQADISALQWLPIATALAAVLGHVFTCFHGFKGGKAVATSLGVLIGLAPMAAGVIFGCWVITWLLCWLGLHVKRSEAVGPSSIVASIAVVPAYLGTAHPWQAPTLGFLALLAILVLVKHRSNFARFVAQVRSRPETP